MSTKHDAITAFVQDCQPEAVVTKFVIVAEVIGHDDATPWDTAGLAQLRARRH